MAVLRVLSNCLSKGRTPQTKIELNLLKFTILIFLLLKSVNLSDVTYYEILGISKQATTQEIRQAFKKLVIKYHPDKNPDEKVQEKFLKITEAYETLKDPDKRHNYDVYGSYPSYTKKYDYKSQQEYNNLYYNGLYHDDPFVDSLSGGGFATYLGEGFHFINFYSPFCPPCQNLVEHWKKLGEIYKGIVKIGAVNCKHHNSFCYNSMRIGSYPSLLFYPNGKNGNFIYYRGDRTFDALEKFVLTNLNSRIYVTTITQIRSTQTPIAYVLGRNRIDENTLTRIGYRLKDLVSLVVAEDDSLREKLTSNEYVTVVFRYKNINKEILSTEEKEILREIVEALPTVEVIEPQDLKEIRNKLRNGYQSPWVLYFCNKDSDRLLLHQIKIAYPNMHVGEIDCDKWLHLCASLHVDEAPAWGLLKPGGVYQLIPDNVDVRSFIASAAEAVKLHTLSAAELVRILDGDTGTWVLLVVPHQLQWDHIVGPFTEASLHFNDAGGINFGILACTMNTDSHCRHVAPNSPTIVVQERNSKHYFSGRHDSRELVQFVNLIRNSAEMELSEERTMEIMDVSSSDKTWLVAFLPAHCGQVCDQLLHQWRIVAEKLKPLEFVRVRYLKCSRFEGLCGNIRSPTMRLYPLSSGQHYTTDMQHLSHAPYMLEWAMQYIDGSVLHLNWQAFSRNVIAEELNPTSTKKPWLVYFHSPRCYRCYEMYADFAITGILLGNNIQLGKVNCVTDHNICQHEQITSYPSLKLYLHRNQHNTVSRVISIAVKDYASLLRDIKPYLNTYEIPEVRHHGFKVKHDEF